MFVCQPDDSILLAGMVDGKLTARRHIEDDPTDKVVEKKGLFSCLYQS